MVWFLFMGQSNSKENRTKSYRWMSQNNEAEDLRHINIIELKKITELEIKVDTFD